MKTWLKFRFSMTFDSRLLSGIEVLVAVVEAGSFVRAEEHRGRQKIRVAVSGRLTANNVRTMLGACVAGYGVAQVLALGAEDLFNSGKLVELFSDWPDE